jgi:DnaK suppressor protein
MSNQIISSRESFLQAAVKRAKEPLLICRLVRGKGVGMAMDREKLEYFRRLLTERLDALLHEAARVANSIAEAQDASGDPTDQATVEGDQTLLLRIRERERGLIVKTREALDRIERGTYGICEECGEAISEKRLMARPVATLCIDCKDLQEKAEQRPGAGSD